jgi:hypothetical protein
MLKRKIQLPNGQIIKRVPKVIPFGNFQMLVIRYKNEEYLIGDGDEYLNGEPSLYILGRKLSKEN